MTIQFQAIQISTTPMPLSLRSGIARSVELAAAYQRIEDLTGHVNRLLELVDFVSSRASVPDYLREHLRNNIRVGAACDAVADTTIV
jgi:hypothetical protein